MYEYLNNIWKKELEAELNSVNQSIRHYTELLARLMSENELEKFQEQFQVEINLKKEILKRLKQFK